ncbi:MAG: hypothetical protein JKY53_12415 [Flavobacteriales bacterium]|nr:hypothetical protein [Flavobacteriales bacterium]
MAISVQELFDEFDLNMSGPVKWGEKLKANYSGVYVIALTNDPTSKDSHKLPFEINKSVFDRWIEVSENLEIGGEKVTSIKQVQKHLKQFWDEDENILYIGESSSATSSVQKRVNQYYKHKVGNKGTHSGGYWLKLISQLSDVCVYHAEAINPRETEFKMIMKFVEKRAGKSFYEIENFSNYFPFANIKVDVLKSHLVSYDKKGTGPKK